MCLAIPGKVTEIFEDHGLPMGRIDYDGTVNTACLAYVPEVKVGQYVIVHAGFALNIIDEEEARHTLELLAQIEDVTTNDELTARDRSTKDNTQSNSK
ncbi:MAG: HypC/HybG/HupF family hydrogenase formation chaperone [Candidatus Zixiibacteriota bacterium]|nr:MAG: HypC/HybG/HupF family hydrogenase formation chaperone [candidate division Zixibacteria bacterium]